MKIGVRKIGSQSCRVFVNSVSKQGERSDLKE